MSQIPKQQTLNESQFYLLQTINKEMEEGFKALNSLPSKTVTFYGGARLKKTDKRYSEVIELGRLLSNNDWGVITGGGPGVMAAALEGAALGKDTGASFRINIKEEPPEFLPGISLPFDMFVARKYMLRQSDAFVYASGGLGTLDELMENLTLMKTQKFPRKPIFLLDADYWQGWHEWFTKTIIAQGFASKDSSSLYRIVEDPEEIYKALVI